MSMRVIMAAGACLVTAVAMSATAAQAQTFYLGGEGGWNVLDDFNFPNFAWPVTPHVGAGIGAVNVIDRARSTNFGQVSRGEDWEFGYQAIAGVRYAVAPNIALDLDYRYLATTDLSLRVPA